MTLRSLKVSKGLMFNYRTTFWWLIRSSHFSFYILCSSLCILFLFSFLLSLPFSAFYILVYFYHFLFLFSLSFSSSISFVNLSQSFFFIISISFFLFSLYLSRFCFIIFSVFSQSFISQSIFPSVEFFLSLYLNYIPYIVLQTLFLKQKYKGHTF